MLKKFDIVKSPETEQLSQMRDELSALEEELAFGELELHTLKLEMDSFQLKYMQTVGVLLAELDRVEDRIAQIEAQLNPLDEETKKTAEQAHARAEESWSTSNNILKEESRVQPSEDLKKLYWEVARKIHPDLCTDERDKARRQKLMVDANVAFEAGDEEKLKAILQDWTALGSEKSSGDTSDVLYVIRMICRIQKRLEQMQSKIAEVRSSELNELYRRVKTASAKGRDLLQDMADEIKVNLALAKHRLKIISVRADNAN